MLKKIFISLLIILAFLQFKYVEIGMAQEKQVNVSDRHTKTTEDLIRPRLSKNGRFLIRNFRERKYVVNGFYDLYCKKGVLSEQFHLYCTNDGAVVGKSDLSCLDAQMRYLGKPENLGSLSCGLKTLPLKELKKEAFNADATKPFFSKKNLRGVFSFFKRIPFVSLPFSPNFKGTDYLIITRPMFLDALSGLVSLKTQRGFNVKVVTLEDMLEPKKPFYADYKGDDIQETLKEFLKKLIQEVKSIKYVLIVGSPKSLNYDNVEEAYNTQYTNTLSYPWEVPIRYIYPEEDWSDGSGGMGIPTDQYYASATSDWDKNSNKIYGEFENEEYSFKPDLYIGRIPIKTADQVKTFVEKLKNWTPTENFQESVFATGGGCGSSWGIVPDSPKCLHKVVCNKCPVDDCGDMSLYVNKDNSNYVSSYGHGYYLQTVGQYQLTKNSLLENNPVVFLHSCQVGGVDYPEDSLAQYLVGNPKGAVAVIAASRSMPDIEFRFKDYIFFYKMPIVGEAFYHYKYLENEENYLSHRQLELFLMYNLFGDPSMWIIPQAKFSIVSDDKIDLQKTNDELTFKVLNNYSDVFGGIYSGWVNVSAQNIPVGETSLTYNVQSYPFQGGHDPVRRNLYFKFNTDEFEGFSNIVKEGDRPLIFLRHAISCNQHPVADEKGNTIVGAKIGEGPDGDLIRLNIYGTRGGYRKNTCDNGDLFDTNFDISNCANVKDTVDFNTSGEGIYTWKAVEPLPTHFWSPEIKESSNYSYWSSLHILEFSSLVNGQWIKIHRCLEFDPNFYINSLSEIDISTNDCKNKTLIGARPNFAVVFPSGKYIIVKDIIPEEGKILYQTFEMENEGELYQGDSIDLPPIGTFMLMKPEMDSVTIKSVSLIQVPADGDIVIDTSSTEIKMVKEVVFEISCGDY